MTEGPNGGDDDANGRIDCADPAAAYVLVVDCGDTLTGSFSAPPAVSDYELTVTVAAPTL